MTDYPRNMCGYGKNPPAANWPGGARTTLRDVAVDRTLVVREPKTSAGE